MKLISVVTAIFAIRLSSSQAVVVLEHHDFILPCTVSPTTYPRFSAVFWYSDVLNEYLTMDFELIPDLNASTLSLHRRLAITGSTTSGRFDLHIADARTEDQGNYKCGYYRERDIWFTVNTVTVEVLVPPGWEFPSCSVQRYQGENNAPLVPGMVVNLTCISYGGSPPATLTWYRDGQPIEDQQAHGGLWIYHQRLLTENDSGVEFTCEATSPALSEPKRCSVVPYHRASRLYIKHNGDGLISPGDSATFTCRRYDEFAAPHGYDVQYRWYVNWTPAEDTNRSVVSTEDGESTLTLLNVTVGDNRSVVTCERVEPYAARSSASLTIHLTSTNVPLLVNAGPTPSDGNFSDDASPLGISLTVAVFSGMFFMLVLILGLRMLWKYHHKRGRLDVNNQYEMAVYWQKAIKNAVDTEQRNNNTNEIEKPVTGSVLTFKKAFPKPSNRDIPADSHLNGRTGSKNNNPNYHHRDKGLTMPCSLSQTSRLATSTDIVSKLTKPLSSSHLSKVEVPLFASPGNRQLGLQMERDYTASMPDLGNRCFGESTLSADCHHDYVNFPAISASTAESNNQLSYANHVKHAPTSSVPVKSALSYAELDLPVCSTDRPPTTLKSHLPTVNAIPRSGSVSAQRTNYAQIAYVFKDRRQQSLPSVKPVGLSKAFGDQF